MKTKLRSPRAVPCGQAYWAGSGAGVVGAGTLMIVGPGAGAEAEGYAEGEPVALAEVRQHVPEPKVMIGRSVHTVAPPLEERDRLPQPTAIGE